jgi:threonyl-tRNA synthetase
MFTHTFREKLSKMQKTLTLPKKEKYLELMDIFRVRQVTENKHILCLWPQHYAFITGCCAVILTLCIHVFECLFKGRA